MNTFRNSRLFLALRLCSLILLLVVISGCGSKTKGGTVKGKITYNDKLVTGGTIAFHSTSGGGKVETGIQLDGTYNLSNIPPGECKVVIETKSIENIGMDPRTKAGPKIKLPKDAMKDAPAGVKPPDAAPDDTGPPMPVYVKIPEKYGKLDTTPEKMDVKKATRRRTSS